MIPKCIAPEDQILKAFDLLKNATSPLVIVGKGSAMTRAEISI